VIGAEDKPHRVDEEDAALGTLRLRGKGNGGFGLGSGVSGFFLGRQARILPEVRDENLRADCVDLGAQALEPIWFCGRTLENVSAV
jgi:hypothetical protein